MIKDFRNVLPWRNYLRGIRRGDDKEQINKFEKTAAYINSLEAQIIELRDELKALRKEVDDGR